MEAGESTTSSMSGFKVPPPAPPQRAAPAIADVPRVEAQPAPAYVPDNKEAPPSTDSTEVKVASRAESDEFFKKTVEERAEALEGLTYEQRCAKVGLSLKQAADIVDELVVDGVYAEVVKVSRTVNVEFVTRHSSFNSHLSRVIDQLDANKYSHLQTVISEYQLAGGIHAYNGVGMPALAHDASEEDWLRIMDQRLKAVGSFAAPVFHALCMKQVKFDAKMLIVFSEGYEENF